MMSQTELDSEIRALIELRLEKGGVDMDDVVAAIVGNHQQIAGDDHGWYLLCANAHVRASAGKITREYDFDPESAEQNPTLPGYEFLHAAYNVIKNGKQRIVRVEDATDDDLLAKADEIRRHGMGALRHADEIVRYVARRAARAVSPN